MKTQSVNKSLVFLALVSLPTLSHGVPLSPSELSSVRAVLRSLNVEESALSNADLEVLRDEGLANADLHLEFSNEKSTMTCGAGSHGGDKDPVRL